MQVRRFTRSEIAVHWTLAASVLAMIATGLALGANVWHAAAFPIHVGSVFILVAGLVLAAGVGDRVALGGLARQLSALDDDDRRWLEWAPAAALGRGAQPPPVGRFNAGQKLNAILIAVLLTASTASGLWWWARLHHILWNSNVDGALHNLAGVAIIVLVCGHVFMAVVNPSTRRALRGITTGSVDRDWAEHHHPGWMAESEEPGAD